MSAAWKTTRVFISSTFRDMQAERDWLVRFVFPKLREELLKHRLHFIDVDLRWGVTSDENALGVCREVIDNCHPRFMCILGGRYGWMPEGQDKSITADEVHYGVLDRVAAKRCHAVFYFRKDVDTLAIPDEDARSGGYREFAQPDETERYGLEKAEAMAKARADKLAALKHAIIDAGLPVRHYEAKWNDAEKRLVGLEKFGEIVYDDLLQSLKADPELAAHFTTDGTATPDEFAAERDQMDAFIEERVDQYILGSREPLMNEVVAFANTGGNPNIFVLTGAPGSGKSALLAKFTRNLAAQPSDIRHSRLVIPHFIGASTGSTDLRRTLRRLCHELAKVTGNTEPLPLDVKELVAHFQKLLTEAAAKQPVILVFDALNQFDETNGAHWLNWLPRELPPGVRVIASVIAPFEGENEHQTLAILRNRKDARVESLKPLNESDTQAIIESYLKRYSKRLSPEQIAALKAKHASNLPLYVLTALEELRTLGTYEEITDRIRTLPGDARALFIWILAKRLARDPGFRDREGRPCGSALVEKFVPCLGVSRHGLSPAELTALLDPDDPLGNVAALLRLLRPYLMRRGELLDFYHGQFREAAVAAYLATPEKQRAAHQSVASCLQAFADPHGDGQCRDATPHAVSELPHHQTRAEAWPDLIATLENIFFLEAKVTHGKALDLTLDFSDALLGLPADDPQHRILMLLEEAFQRDIHFIALHGFDCPQAVFQCLWNSAWWFDCPKVANGDVASADQSEKSGEKLHRLLERWRQEKEAAHPNAPWLRSLRPPVMPLGSAQRLLLRGHEGTVRGIAFSPDGRRIASGSDDGTVRVWDSQSGAELSVLYGHEGPVCDIVFSPDGRRIASGSDDRTVRVWDSQSGAQISILVGHEWTVSSIAFSPDGRRIASGSRDKSVRVWDSHSGAQLLILCGSKYEVDHVCFSQDGSRIVSKDRKIRLWDVQTGEELDVLPMPEYSVFCMRSVPGGLRFASSRVMDRRSVWVRDAYSGVVLAVLRGHEGAVRSVDLSLDGRYILSGSEDETVRLWDAQCGREMLSLHGHEGSVGSVIFSPDGRWIASGSEDKTVRVWDTYRAAKRNLVHRPVSRASVACFSPDGEKIAIGSKDNTVRVVHTESGTESSVLLPTNFDKTQVTRASLIREISWVTSVGFSPDGLRIAGVFHSSLIGPSDEHTVCVWDTQSSVELALLKKCTTDRASFSPDGRRFAVGQRDESKGSWVVSVWNAIGGATPVLLCGSEEAVKTVSFSPNGNLVCAGSADGTVRLWDAQNGARLAVLRGHHGGVSSVGFSPDGRLIVSAGNDKTSRVWEVQSGLELAVLRGHEHEVASASFSPDGQRIITGIANNYPKSIRIVRVWDAHNFDCIDVIRDVADITAISKIFTLCLFSRKLETVFEEATSARQVAWLPVTLQGIATHPSARAWAGFSSDFLALFQLEGTVSGT